MKTFVGCIEKSRSRFCRVVLEVLQLCGRIVRFQILSAHFGSNVEFGCLVPVCGVAFTSSLSLMPAKFTNGPNVTKHVNQTVMYNATP